MALTKVPQIMTSAVVQTKTTTYTALVTDDIINASGSAFTITLYAASGNSGKTITINKTDSSFTNIITIEGNASETINGDLNTTLNTQYESVTLYCDGSNWFIMIRNIPSTWSAYTPTFTNFGTVTGASFTWRRVGSSVDIGGVFTTGTTVAAEARISLPSGLTSASNLPTLSKVGDMGSALAEAASWQINIEPSITYMTMGKQGAGSAGFTKGNGNSWVSSTAYSLIASVPIAGWK